MSDIKSFKISYINLVANTVYTHNLQKPGNLFMVRNPSSAIRVLFGDDSGITTARYQAFADVDGGGAFMRPEKVTTLYFLATQNIDRVVVEEYEVGNPAAFILSATKSPTGDVNVSATVGLKPGDLSLDAQKHLHVDIETMPNVVVSTLPNVVVSTLPNITIDTISAGTAVKVTAAGAGDIVVKATPGSVAAIRAAAGVNVTLKDNATEKWYIAAGTKDDFPYPIGCATNITLTFDAAGDAWIIYK